MSGNAAAIEVRPAAPGSLARVAASDLAVALLSAAVLFVLSILPYLRGRSLLGDDNDSMLRLVEVRDLIGGQGWFDLTQYRMGLPGGFEMHWSRIIDTPLAALVLAGEAPGLSQHAAETFTLYAWPALLSVPALYAILRAARNLGGREAVLPAAALGIATLFYTGQFGPGSIDHHSAQATLALLFVMLLATDRLTLNTGLLAGIAVAFMAGIGAETHPHVAFAAIGAALVFVFEGQRGRAFAIGFGLGFAASLLVLFFGTVSPEHYGRTTCDALSIAQAVPGIAGGLALALAAGSAHAESGAGQRLIRLAIAGVLAGAVALKFAGPCLGDPLAGMDPLVRKYWLDSVEEARPLGAVLLENPAIGLGYGVTPLIALGWLAYLLAKGTRRPALFVAAGAIAVSFAIALIQVRGAILAMLLSTIPLATMVAAARARAMANGALRHQLVMVGAWVVSVSLVWALIGAALDRSSPEDSGGQAAANAVKTCTDAEDWAGLAGEPPATVFAISNLGPAILLNTAHRAVAGPYHRNIAGLHATIAALIATPDDAEALVRATGATLVAACAGNPETRFYANVEPAGFGAALAAGKVPAWLAPIGDGTRPVALYRVRPQS